jgi:5-formyltetrahydrofolate cyclo-ligase
MIGPGSQNGPGSDRETGPEGAPQAKKALRRLCRGLRAAAVANEEAAIQAVTQRELPALLRPGQRLGLYWPLAGEPDLRAVAASLGPLALPAVVGSAPRLVYRPWQPGDPLAPDACGIPAPTGADLEPGALGLLLVPALAFDPRGGIRLGYGGGWYDRLRAAPAWRAVPALAVLPAACLRSPLPHDPWDVPFPGWLDGRGLHRRGPV